MIIILRFGPLPSAVLVNRKPKIYQNEVEMDFVTQLNATKQSIISHIRDIEKQDVGYIIYDCSKSFRGRCGGWNDRITGVIETLMISLITNKKFRIVIDTPCDTINYFIPKEVDWTIHKQFSIKKAPKLNFIDRSVYRLDVNNISRHFQTFVTRVRNNWDVMDKFRVTDVVKKKIPWICDVHHADIYKIIFDILFQPTQSVLGPISKLSIDKSKKLVCAHARIGTNPLDKNHTFAGGLRMPFNKTSVLLKFLETFDKKTTNIYVATDSPMLKRMVMKKFPENSLDIPGNLMLVDIDRGAGACGAYAKSLSEFWLLTKCDVLVLTRSGFGMLAAYLMDNTKSLYFMVEEKIVPCRRYDLIEYYPTGFHGPKSHPITRRHNITHDYCPPGQLKPKKGFQ